MKIVCDACSAKYSIADDKVKGKVFKIRCKKCSNIIVVRGTAGGGAAEEPPPAQFDQKDTRVYDYGYDEQSSGPGGDPAGDADAVWHVVIDQEQVGPLSVADVGQKFAAGQIDAETYVWREGFADWQPLASIDVFQHLTSGGGGSSGADAVASMFGGGGGDDGGTVRSNPDDLFAARAGGGAAADEGDVDGDLFGARGGGAPAAQAQAQAADKGGGKLRGERNENSVLFSLGNLAALASDSPRASAASSSSSSSSSSGGGGGAAQHGGGEGSGLIDIRSMASAYLGPQGAKKQGQQSNVGSIDDLPVFSSAAFSEPAVIMPVPARGGNNKTMMMLMAGVAALAVIAIVLVLVVFLGGKDSAATAPPAAVAKTDEPPEDKGTTPEDKGTTPPGDDGTKTPDEGTTPPTEDKGAAVPPPEDKVDEKKDEKKDDDKRDDRRDSRRDSKRDDKKDEKKDEKKEPVASSGGSCPDEVGCLLSEKPPACCAKYSKGKKKDTKKDTGGGGGGADADLPESLDSGLIKAGVGKVKSRIFGCGDKFPSAKGTLKLSVKVNSGGSVTDVDVVSSPDPGLGSCAASAMKGAKFAKTQRGGSFKYPFNF